MSLLFSIVLGLAIFLFGMTTLESGIRDLGYETFKRWLSRSTRSPLASVSTGVGTTAILQSSSMVSLLVLAFASAGVLPLYNAVGIILGANLGTTMTGWVVATIGFKLQLQDAAVPLMGIGCLAQLVTERYRNVLAAGKLLLGLGLLLFGLGLMKEAVAELPSQWEISRLQGYGPWLYFLVGTLMAALIQSSSAVMMITMTALYSGLIELQMAAALVIGADLGTTSTTMLGSLKGSSIKKRLALAHFSFNFVVDILTFIFLLPLLPGFLHWIGVADPLYALVGFHSTFNFFGLIVFMPFLQHFVAWLEKRFVSEEHPLLVIPAAVPEAAIKGIRDAVGEMLEEAVILNLQDFKIDPEQLSIDKAIKHQLWEHRRVPQSFEHRYETLKRLEAEILGIALRLQAQPISEAQAQALLRLIESSRAVVYSCKTLKDIRDDLASLRHSNSETLQALYKRYEKFQKSFYSQFLQLIHSDFITGHRQEKIAELLAFNDRQYQLSNEEVHEIAAMGQAADIRVSTLLNINRETHHAGKNLLQALDIDGDLSTVAAQA